MNDALLARRTDVMHCQHNCGAIPTRGDRLPDLLHSGNACWYGFNIAAGIDSGGGDFRLHVAEYLTRDTNEGGSQRARRQASTPDTAPCANV